MTTYNNNDTSALVDMILWECYQKGIEPRALFQTVLDNVRKGDVKCE